MSLLQCIGDHVVLLLLLLSLFLPMFSVGLFRLPSKVTSCFLCGSGGMLTVSFFGLFAPS